MRFGRCRNTSQSQNTLKSSKNNPEKCLDAPRADTITKTRCLLDTNAIFHEKRRFRVRMKNVQILYSLLLRGYMLSYSHISFLWPSISHLCYIEIFRANSETWWWSGYHTSTKNADFQCLSAKLQILYSLLLPGNTLDRKSIQNLASYHLWLCYLWIWKP